MGDLSEIRRVYEMVDENGDGVVTVNELLGFINKLGIKMSHDDLRFVLVRKRGEKICRDNLRFQDFVDLYEFIFNREEEEEEDENGSVQELMEAFNVFDDNKDGFISSEELQRVLSSLGLIPHTQPPHYFKNLICRFDSDHNGVLDFSEFKNMMASPISP